MTYPELAAQSLQPSTVPYAALPVAFPEPAGAPQGWKVTVASAKYHWYDLIAGFPQVPDIRDPVGRYLRRMQFDLEGASEKHLLYFVITRPRVRFDTARAVQWGFFSLKLTLPLLMGSDASQESVTIELKVPFAATMKKPTVTVTESFITLNWGGLVEALSIHDVLQNYVNNLKIPSKVIHVGLTRDPDSRLACGRLPEVQKLHQQHSTHSDTLLLVQEMDVEVACSTGDPADLDINIHPVVAATLARERMDVIEAAAIRYFEGESPSRRKHEEKCLRRTRVVEAQARHHLVDLQLDIELPEAGNYRYLMSDHAASASRHLFSCDIVDGDVSVARLPLPVKTGKAAKV